MKLSKENIQEFIKLYNQEFGYISEADAREMAIRLVELYTLLAQPLPSEVAEVEKVKRTSTD